MKRLSVLALIMAAGIAGSTVLPAQAASADDVCEQWRIKKYVIANGQAVSGEDLKNMLSEICKDYGINWNDCLNGSTPETSVPETETPETNAPETETPETNTPETETPETNAPETETPETNTPETNAPETNIPETNAPETSTPETNTPETESPEGNSFVEQVVSLVNAERRKAGLKEVVLDKEIASAALTRAKEIEVSFSHTRPDGRYFSTVLTDNGITYSGSGENIAWGQKTPQDVMDAWMNSDGHRANILNARFTKIGVGYYQNASGRNFWTQLFTY